MPPPDVTQERENQERKIKRTPIIPYKRPLLPTTSLSSQHKTRIQKTINPSAIPAEFQLRRPVFSSVEPGNNDENAGKYDIDNTPIQTVEFDSSLAPQPFLEPELVQRRIAEERQRKGKDADDDDDESEDQKQGESSLAAQLSTEREVRRRAAQAEYGSMAIRDRRTVRGRGRRRRR